MEKKSTIKHDLTMCFIYIILMISLVVGSVFSYAWFFNRRGLQTLTEITSPYVLRINGMHQSEMYGIDLSDVDFQSEKKYAYVAFSVVGDFSYNYIIELAHTTNISSLSYEIYHSTENSGMVPSNLDVPYYSENNTTYYYTIDNKVTGRYLNDSNGDGVADSSGSYHNATYGAYTNVQSNAEPLYWLSSERLTLSLNDENYCDYYIMKLSWDDTIPDNKETDMVYLTVETE